jgi:hypothetical protein
MRFGVIVVIMALQFKNPTLSRVLGLPVILAVTICMVVSGAYAETYRWKDKDGNIHYGAVVPAEYAEQPYDVLNDAGMVIERVEDTTVPRDVAEEQNELEKKKGRQPLISEEERQIQADRLLLVQYRSEEEIAEALELEINQLGYDNRIIDQSFESTSKAIRDNIKNAADQQRANMPVSEEREKEISRLYARRAQDEQRREAMRQKEEKIRERFKRDLERYRFLTEDAQEEPGEPAEQG